MNPLLLTALVILALAATLRYFFGMRQNRFIASTISRGAEEALRPSTTNYVNIGGTIGHNFAYSLSDPWTSAKGTITLSPRHSLLYLPISRLLGIEDRFFVNIFTKKKLRGEAHLIDSKHLRSAKIDGIERMERRETEAGGRRFTLLWSGADLSRELESLLAAMPDPARLRHFCAYPDNRTFFLHTLPRKGVIAEDLRAVLPRLGDFLERPKE
ncbi:MAG: hypothetical protein NT080_09450 [Spirochaetes bacterium]|nr:hypothetical protein [Spirochaetota bacterium]